MLTANVPVEDPPATVTLPRTVAYEVLLDETEMVVPPLGARPLRVTGPVDVDPPMTVVGLRARPTRFAGLMVRLPTWLVPFNDPVMVTGVALATPVVPIVKVAVVAPPNTVTGPETVAFELLEVNVTDVPPTGAAPLSVTVPVADAPDITDAGAIETDVRAAGFTVKVEGIETPPCVAVIVTEVEAPTGIE